MPRGGARPGAGRPKRDPGAAPARKSLTTAKKPSPPKAAAPPASKKTAGGDAFPALFIGPQKIEIPMDYESIYAAVGAWLKKEHIYEHIDPGLLELYVTCLARVRQYEQAVSKAGIVETNIVSGQKYESPLSKAAREYMKRAQAAEAQIHEVIRRVSGESEAGGASDLAKLLGGAAPWRK